MEVDETMFPGQVHHPRFIGERVGRQQQVLPAVTPEKTVYLARAGLDLT